MTVTAYYKVWPYRVDGFTYCRAEAITFDAASGAVADTEEDVRIACGCDTEEKKRAAEAAGLIAVEKYYVWAEGGNAPFGSHAVRPEDKEAMIISIAARFPTKRGIELLTVAETRERERELYGY